MVRWRTALLCSSAASANDPAVVVSVMNWGQFMGPCHTSHYLLIFYIGCVGKRDIKRLGGGIEQLRILAVNFYFCLCISGDHLVGKGINHAEGSVTEGNPLPPGLYYLLSI